ncbi:short chain dehydrogenase [Cutaneotrichosporon oleaginosum]|uniref:Short chain dehydrogenase n=1 Tax=Cutaneotrichosporon oleaginosum TaxID=879819 RepID=A0A0J0XZ04_9TREE|nr:short chain dehydrogenase [Cutaneotrichosporon oleaginosum]KLT46261.1 short chain dehydrogenase [Cutaneotrichosporon oleaginosum]TXT10265.1 hypothetical protein COLE_04199 [Cutaneotrichosporon oleaginosum]
MFSGVAFVTGAASGIGQATAQSFARKGVKRIVLVDLGDLSTTIALLQNVETLPIKADVSDEAQVKSAVQGAVDKWGRIDYAANCAGIGCPRAKFADTTTADFEKTMGVNARGCFICSREQIRQMLSQEPLETELGPRRAQRGAIVNVASILGLHVRWNIAPYTASKHAVVSLARQACLDHGADGVRINTVAPGLVETPMTAGREVLTEDSAPEVVPMARPGLPEELADVITFMCSEEASYVNGATWCVDGGRMVH